MNSLCMGYSLSSTGLATAHPDIFSGVYHYGIVDKDPRVRNVDQGSSISKSVACSVVVRARSLSIS